MLAPAYFRGGARSPPTAYGVRAPRAPRRDEVRTTFVVLLITVTLVLSSLTYGGLELYRREALQRNQASIDESAALAADRIATRVRERRDDIGYVASQPATANVSDSGTTVGGVVNNSRFFAAQVVAANGTVVAFGGQSTRDWTTRRRRWPSETVACQSMHAALRFGVFHR